jgi:hypothetical protein
MADFIDAKGEFFTKDAVDVGVFTVDWAPFLAGDTITGTPAVWFVPTGIVKDTQSQTATTTSVKLSSGTAGIEYALTVTIGTTAGNTWKKTLRIVITPFPPLAANALIDLDYLKTFLGVYEAEPLQSIDNVLFGHLIDSASEKIERYLKRTIKTADYIKRVKWAPSINLSPFPVHYVRGIYQNTRDGFNLTNAATNKDSASAWITENRKLYLEVSGGTSHGMQSIDLTLPTNDTLSELITAINLLSGNWTATLASGLTGFERSENLIAGLAGRQVPQTGLKIQILGAPLECEYQLNEESGILFDLSAPYSIPFYEGYPTWVKFRGGYDVIPEDLKSITARICQFYFAESKRDPGLLSERIGDYSYERISAATDSRDDLSIPANLRHELNLWVDMQAA